MTVTTQNFALNPLQYFATADGWLDPELGPSLEARLDRIARAGFGAIQSEVPASLTPGEYKKVLTDAGIAPGPGYVGLQWSEDADARRLQVERARAVARDNVELGTPLVFLAMGMNRDSARVLHPAVGYDHSADRLAAISEYVAEASTAMAAEGAVAALHPHVGGWIETADETRFVLDAVNADVLRFGPDVGHLAWTGIEPSDLIAEYADRVAGIHLKDYRTEIAAGSRAEDWDYRTTARHGIWTELGTGDANFDRVFDVLPATFDGWVVVEVDRGTTPTPDESINICAEWLRERFGGITAAA